MFSPLLGGGLGDTLERDVRQAQLDAGWIVVSERDRQMAELTHPLRKHVTRIVAGAGSLRQRVEDNHGVTVIGHDEVKPF